MTTDPRRRIPRTDDLLNHPAVRDASLSATAKKALVQQVQAKARAGEIAPEDVLDHVRAQLPHTPTSLHPVLNATGVVVHTNLGRAPLSHAARCAIEQAAGYTDVELELESGQRSSRRGAGALDALLDACPEAEAALVVNNAAAALVLTCAALNHHGRVVISRGELIEIGAGFRLPELIESARVELVEVGATNRTHLSDYAAAPGAFLKVHPSNYRVEGFTAEASVAELADLAEQRGAALIVDVGSGLLRPDALMPAEPPISEALADGADVVLASGDKLLGGPQAGIILGKKEAIAACARHPLARAVRIDKIRLAALEATVAGGNTPVERFLHAEPDELYQRCRRLAEQLPLECEIVEHDGRVGGGGAPGLRLKGYALRLPEYVAARLRAGDVPVLARVKDGACLVDPRCIEPADEAALGAALVAAWKEQA
ncbi:L-seryl-tRNA(Sec) selenium transferase [Corynebacterium tapiri]|uniref:L-seryl-tRNA(Sec) selenium transferase n=1 Tax=Corynebacterium tapiri TaxID=1448266 RepID=A0A5C4U6Y2_9CORY|nr:L-seryl-tRNA(Sec) selenium transferase [Corynebacterium tapiri]TNM00539.1 L-seryl-tRNA(Sec) selenium transferase [Corynebacterium tapiri]